MTASASREWTPAQLDAMQSIGGSLLVSAAAGSGKTAVLAERCAHLVCDAPAPCDIDQLLVVTFTEAAANEMRTRIRASIAARLDAATSQRQAQRIQHQALLVDHAQISTIHGFCARLLRQHFHLAGIDPSFSVMDADEASLLRAETAAEVLRAKFDKDEDGSLAALIDAYGDGQEDFIISQIIQVDELLSSLALPDVWLEKMFHRLSEAAEQPLHESELGQVLLKYIRRSLNRLQKRCDLTLNRIARMGRFGGYEKMLVDWRSVIVSWVDTFNNQGFDALRTAVKNFDGGRAPSVKADVPGKDTAKSLLDAVKKQMTSGPLADYLSFSQAQWQEGHERLLPHARTLLALVREFRSAYGAAKERDRMLDFADLERKTLDILRDPAQPGIQPSELASTLQNQYAHVLVDEYQDINELQDAILTFVSRESSAVADEANLFAVGDVKQSIYRFRLADPERFLQRVKSLRERENQTGRVIDLRENFRSRPALLDAINQVFVRTMTREAAEIEYDQSHHLQSPAIPVMPEHATCFRGAPIEMHLLPGELTRAGQTESEEEDENPSDTDRTEYEATFCARRILELTGKAGGQAACVADRDAQNNPITRPAGLSDIVILLRSLKHKADVYVNILRQHGIAAETEGGSGFFEAEEIRDMLALLEVLDNQKQDIPLACVLRSPIAQIAGADDLMARVRLAYPASSEVPFHQAVLLYATDQRGEPARTLRVFLDQLLRWRDAALQTPLADLIWRIYSESGYLAFSTAREDGAQRNANLLHLHEMARRFGSFHKQGLHRFIGYLTQLREGKELARPPVAGQAGEAVRIISVHKSKGLEFPIVILPDLGKRHNLTSAKGAMLLDRAAGLGMMVVDEERMIRYPSLGWRLVRDRIHRLSIAEEMRVLYVAMTRAREHLILVGTCQDNACERWMAHYQGHAGPLDPEAILEGGSLLDWIGPVYAATGGTTSDVIELTQHTVDEARQWPSPRAASRKFSPAQEAMARLQPLDPPPLMNERARRILARIDRDYAFEEMTRRPAAAAATSLNGATSAASLAVPRFIANAATPVDAGSAAHRLLEVLDFKEPFDASSIDTQIQALVNKSMLSPSEAELINRNDIAWFMQSDLANQIRVHCDTVHRELSFSLLEAGAREVRDATMVRGRIDLLFRDDTGWVVVDFKTDAKLPASGEIPADYVRQVNIYRAAVMQIAGQPVSRVDLVFLRARTIISVTGDQS